MTSETRRRRAKGDWAQLRDAGVLAGWMKSKDMSQARLARYAECSRQFIYQLLSGQRTTCTPLLAARIEEALQVVPGTLFDLKKSCATEQRSAAA